jgi:hypothetical protein
MKFDNVLTNKKFLSGFIKNLFQIKKFGPVILQKVSKETLTHVPFTLKN